MLADTFESVHGMDKHKNESDDGIVKSRRGRRSVEGQRKLVLSILERPLFGEGRSSNMAQPIGFSKPAPNIASRC